MTSVEVKKPPFLILMSLSAIGPFAMNIFTPSMPSMMSVFNVNYDRVQFTLTLYLIALAIAQLFMGPLSDRFGRRPVALWGILIFLAGSLICVAAPDIFTLSLGRAIQAIGGCAGVVIARTMVRDIYGTNKAAQMIAGLALAMMIVPIVAPTLGGALDENFGWEASFYAVFTFAAFVFIAACFYLKETHFNLHESISISHTLLGFHKLLGLLSFNKFAFQISFSSAAFFAFVGGSPYVVIELMEQSPTEYGLYFMAVGAAYMLGNFITTRASASWGINHLINLGVYIATTGGIFLMICYLTDNLNPLTLYSAMAIIAFANGLSIPTSIAGAISADVERIGASAGLVGFLQIAAGASASYIVGNMLNESAAPLVFVMFGSVILAFSCYKLTEFLEKQSKPKAT